MTMKLYAYVIYKQYALLCIIKGLVNIHVYIMSKSVIFPFIKGDKISSSVLYVKSTTSVSPFRVLFLSFDIYVHIDPFCIWF